MGYAVQNYPSPIILDTRLKRRIRGEKRGPESEDVSLLMCMW